MKALMQLRQRWLAQAQAFWQARSEQERRFLSVGGAVLALALAYSVLVAPALEGRARLRRDLPLQRQETAELQALALEAAELKGRSKVAPPAMTRDSLNASLAARSLTAQSLSVTGEYVKLQLNGVPFAGVVAWLDGLRRDGRITVQEALFSAKGEAGMVDATLTLRQDSNPGAGR